MTFIDIFIISRHGWPLGDETKHIDHYLEILGAQFFKKQEN